MAGRKIKKIIILGTGGTIASCSTDTLSGHYDKASVGISDLIQSIPELTQIADVEYEQVEQVLSNDMTQDVWFALLERLNARLADPLVDGVVITHGTDAIAETAYFLHLTTQSDKPVVLTGAMRTANALGADGPLNLLNAVVLACSEAAYGKGVLLTFNAQIYGARGITKVNLSTLDGFGSSSFGVLGYIHGTSATFYVMPTTVRGGFDIRGLSSLPRVEIVYGYMDSSRVIVDALIQDGVVGIVGAGMGNGYQSIAATEALVEARKKGIMVVRSSRVLYGMVTPHEILDGQHQFISGNSLTPQQARILLSLLLTQTQDRDIIQQAFNHY